MSWVFEFDTHEVVVQEYWVSIDGHKAVHLSQRASQILRHPEGLVVDGTLLTIADLLRIIRLSTEEEEAEEDDSDGHAMCVV